MGTQSALVSYPVARPKREGLCGVIILLGDLMALLLALGLPVLGRAAWGGDYDPSEYLPLIPVIGLFPVTYAISRLYPGVAFNPVAELRQLTVSTTLVFGIISMLLFMLKAGPEFSRLVFLTAWLAAMFLVPLTRTLIRARFGAKEWWRIPVAVLGSPEDVEPLMRKLSLNPEIGLSPVAVASRPTGVSGVAYPGDPGEEIPAGVIVAGTGLDQYQLARLIDEEATHFSRIYVFPNLHGLSCEGVEARDLGFGLTLEIRRSLLLPSHQLAKNVLDRGLSVILVLILSPILLLIALLIRLESKGPALFNHVRIGRGGEPFRMWKFRSMFQDGDRVLREHFRRNPEAQAEWARQHKLKMDPRITPLGRFLRKTSLDEVPQLWNVIKGDMSLVGPRPIVAAEVDRYGEAFRMYCQVMPGLTGMWQVSGRSETDYGQRVDLDTYYVRNWSPWLDLYLLSRTVKVVFKGEGAY